MSLLIISLSAYLVFTLAIGVQTVSTDASFGNSVCGFRGRALLLKHEWILNCTTPHEVPRQRELTLLIDQISPRLLPWSLEFILNSESRIKYAETVHS